MTWFTKDRHQTIEGRSTDDIVEIVCFDCNYRKEVPIDLETGNLLVVESVVTNQGDMSAAHPFLHYGWRR